MRSTYFIILVLICCGGGYATAQADSIRRALRHQPVARLDSGVASYYHSRFQGSPTASGELYDERLFTAAHNRLKFGSFIRVTGIRNGRSVVVKVNDRLHHRNTRIVDLSMAAARKLGMVSRGLIRVRVELLEPEEGRKAWLAQKGAP